MGNLKIAKHGQDRNSIIRTKREILKARIDTGEITIGEIYCIKKLLGLDNEELCKIIKI
jgi:plasmid stability protein